ncbi:MAG: GspE/PulE family protein [Candidatus Doudnabacteria bacterium]|nr:GspE/PulE family protein [Candidatus Doudnabacteria bacterium]
MMIPLKDKIETELAKASGISIISLVHDLIIYAHSIRSSDIHLDPAEKSLRSRFRVDGVLRDTFSFPKHIHSEIISRIKILSGLRTDEHQAAQDGRFRLNVEGQSPLDIRVSIAPTYYGENAVLRLLADRAENFTLETLGFSEQNRSIIAKAVNRPYGMILVTGPTGSGKTTTLYTILKMLNTPQVSIVTIEDPVEYAVEGVEQIGVNPRTGLTFAHGLRSILRQDPNIIMVGEIRDAETAGIAINVALTGHLLLSTLHTNDPATTLPRLLDMKIESYLVASTVNVAVGQRLVRKICPNCRRQEKITAAQSKNLAEIFGLQPPHDRAMLYSGKGCADCNYSGYRGRIALHEIIEISEPIREAILRKATAREINSIAIAQGMITMMEDGLEKALAGITTIEEVLRVGHE